MLILTGVFDNDRLIPDSPVSIPQRKKLKITIEEEQGFIRRSSKSLAERFEGYSGEYQCFEAATGAPVGLEAW